MSKRQPQRHPSDVLEEALALASARRRFEEWMKNDDNRDAVHALVMTFSDEDAETLLEIVREKFWSEP